MIYKQTLAIRKSLMIFCATLFVFGIASAAVNQPGKGQIDASIQQQALFLFAWLSAIFAAILGSDIGIEGSTVSRSTLTLPVPRWKVAASIFVVDIVGVAASFLIGTAAFLIPTIVLHWGHVNYGPPISAATILVPLAFAFAVYALSAVLSLPLRRTPYLSAAAPAAAMVIFLFGSSNWAAGSIFRIINLFNPVAYFIPAANKLTNPGATYQGFANLLTPMGDAGLMLLLALLGLAVALIQWQRLQVA